MKQILFLVVVFAIMASCTKEDNYKGNVAKNSWWH